MRRRRRVVVRRWGGKRFISQKVELMLQREEGGGSGCGRVRKFTLDSYQTLPKDEEKFVMEMVGEKDGEDASSLCIEEGEKIPLLIRLVVRPTCSQVHVDHLLLLSFHGETWHSSVSVSSAECMVGLRVQGTLMSDHDMSLSGQLSADALPFKPKVALNYFDSPCPVFSFFDSVAPKTVYATGPPPGFKYAQQRHDCNLQISWLQKGGYDLIPPMVIVKKHLQDCPSSTTFDGSPMRKHLKYLINLHTLNQMEIFQMYHDIRLFDVRYSYVKFRAVKGDRNTVVFTLKVKGSSENRPKIRVGGTLLLRPVMEDVSDHELIMFQLEAVVTAYQLQDETVTCICPKPPASPGIRVSNGASTGSDTPVVQLLNQQRYHVRFSFDLWGSVFVQSALRAVHSSTFLQLSLFPPLEYAPPPQSNSCFPMLSGLMIDDDLNMEQREAVHAVCNLLTTSRKHENGTNQPTPIPPYIIFGPPGTGKTKTLTSVIRGVVEGVDGVRVLACAPSDAAADVLCSRLSQFFSPDEMHRLNWWQRQPAAVPLNILSYCNEFDGSTFDIPDDLSKFKIVVCTFVVAGALFPCNTSNSFDLVILDEVSQASEAESFVPIILKKSSGVVVLCGDPEQLGPVSRSPIFRAAGMQQSLQERLLQHPIYDSVHPHLHADEDTDLSTLRCSYGVYLRHNYRSQRSIFEVSSRLFYQNSLVESGSMAGLDCLGNWELLSKSRFSAGGSELKAVDWIDYGGEGGRPFLVLFRSVATGSHQNELNSPSFFNISEIACVVETCSKLIQSRRIEVTPQDIGVIGGFRAQVLKLRQALRAAHLGGINVGGVEDYQGQECKVVIISTVLSSPMKQLEVNGSLGLCGDHRKFNVAVTRGKCLTIVVGNPFYLHADRCWRELMNYCDSHEAFVGDPCQLLSRLQREQQDEEDMLSAAAQAALLDTGSNFNVIQGDRVEHGLNLQYGVNGSELEWRGLL